jgi:subtilisin family serine protease
MQLLTIILMLAALPPVPGKITADLASVLENTPASELITVIVHMNTEYPYAQIEGMNYMEKCQVFKDVAFASQEAVVGYIRALPPEQAVMGGQFWIFNGFHLKATPDVVRTLAARNDIWFICSNATVQLDFNPGEDAEPPRTPEWNISKICADSCWNAGFSGAGIILGHIDTGVLTTHEALAGKWVSPYWVDGVNGQASPYDDHGHGTHTMGTICGGDGPGPLANDVGVAYGATFIPTKAFNSGGSGSDVSIDTCMNYLANLKAGGVDIRAIGNSWGNGDGTYIHWWPIVLNWQALGVLPVFSNGNSGPGSGTVGSPGSYPMSIGIGSTNSSDAVSSYSSRGPAPSSAPFNDPQYWYYSTWNYLKPDVSAPGENVRSSYNNGGYTSMSGTSMASPHVTGSTAVLLQKNPALTVTELYDLFRDYCDQPSGYTYPNMDYGWGRINLWRSLQNVPMSNRPNVVLSRTAIVNDNNANGKLDPGENAGITSYIKNTGGVNATNVNGTLRTTTPTYITVTDSLYSYGTLLTGDSANNTSDPYDITVSPTTPPGTVVAFNLVLAAAETTWTRPFSYVVGIAPGTIIWGPKPAPSFPAGGLIYGVAYDRTGDQLFVTDGYGRSIYRYSSDSFVTYAGSYTGPDTGLVDICYVRATDQLYVTSYMQKQVWKLNKSTGAVIRQFANPANDYPIGLLYRPPNTMWFADRRVTLGNPGLIYIGDTLGNATQYQSPVVGYYNTRCLAYDSLGSTLLHTQTWFNSGGTAVDSVGLVEMTTAAPPALTGRRMLLNVGWNLRGIEFDPRDGNYWITIPQITNYVNDIVKIRGFYAPSFAVTENKEPVESDKINLTVSPNPATRQIAFNFRIAEVTNVTLTLFDCAGRKVVQLIDREHFNAGSFQLNWNRQDYGHNVIADGVYFITLRTDHQTISQKLVLTR